MMREAAGCTLRRDRVQVIVRARGQLDQLAVSSAGTRAVRYHRNALCLPGATACRCKLAEEIGCGC